MHKQVQASGRPEAVLQTTASLFSHLDAAPCWSPVSSSSSSSSSCLKVSSPPPVGPLSFHVLTTYTLIMAKFAHNLEVLRIFGKRIPELDQSNQGHWSCSVVL